MFKLDFKTLEHDFFGGLTAGVVALPLALAFGVQSGLGAEAGLYGAIILGFIAALLGGTATQVSGPTGPITVLTASVIAAAIQTYGNIENALPSIVIIFALAGLFQILLGLLKLGKYIRYIPYPVISGFMTGIGLIIILLQLFPAMGHDSPTKIYKIFFTLGSTIMNLNEGALFLTIATVALIYLTPKVTKAIPGSIVALVLMTLASYLFKLKVPLIGDIPKGLPIPQLSPFMNIDLAMVKAAIVPAFMIATLGSLDSLLTSIIADNKTKTTHDSNRELIGQGIGNFAASLFGGLPGAGATMRTVVNINNGGKTKLSGMIHSLSLLAILLGFSKLAALIPLSVLAGILFTVGVSIIDYKGLKHLFVVPRGDAFIILVVIVLTLFIGLTEAVITGFALASIMFMKKVSEVTEDKSTVVSAADVHNISSWKDEKNIPEKLCSKIYIKHLDGPLFFGFTSHFRVLTNSIPNIEIVIFRLRHVPYMDQSGLYAIEDAFEYLTNKGIRVYLTGLNEQPRHLLHETNIIPGLISENFVFNEFNDLIHALEKETD